MGRTSDENDQSGRRGDRQDARPAPAPVSVREKSGHLVPDREVEAPPAPSRRFTLDDEEWIARLMGQGHGGTGSTGPTVLVAVRFYTADAPDDAVREVLLPRGRFESLYEEELRELYARATEIDAPT